jgi:hypothetical protein
VNYSIFFAFELFTGLTACANAQSDSGSTSKAVAVPETKTKYLVVHQESDPHFITSVERIGPCTLRGTPLDTAGLTVPYQIYPAESVKKHEEGSVMIQLIFGSDWCVRKATIVESTKFWRLDYVSLQWAMTIKWIPKNTLFTSDGEPTVTIPIAWGASQGRR